MDSKTTAMTSSDLPLRIKKRAPSASSEHEPASNPPIKRPKPSIPLPIRTHKSNSSTASPSSSSQASSHTQSPQSSVTNSSHADEESSASPRPAPGLNEARREIALLILDAAQATVQLEDAGFPLDENEEYGADDEDSSDEEDAFTKSYREGSR